MWRPVDEEIYIWALNESPSEKEGKSHTSQIFPKSLLTLNESPSEKEGKSAIFSDEGMTINPALNESPSEKEGK